MLGQEGFVDIQVLHRQGVSIKGIARELGVSRNTVRKYLRADQAPEFKACRSRPSKLDPFKDYLQQRVAAAHPHPLPQPTLAQVRSHGEARRLRPLLQFLRLGLRDPHAPPCASAAPPLPAVALPAGDGTVVLMGHVSGRGTLVVKTARPHELRLDSEMPGRGGLVESRIRLDPSASSQLLIVRTLLLRGDWPAAESSIRILLNGKEIGRESSSQPGGGVRPRVDIHGSGEEGFTWVCYPNIVSFPRPPDEASTALRDLGFSSIIVPFYGNPHFVREGLHLRPVYQDRWLQAYPLAPR